TYLSRGEDDDAWQLVTTVISTTAVVVGGAALLLVFLARPLMELLVPGRDPAFKDLAAELTRVMLVSPVFFSISGFVTSVLQSHQRFGWAVIAPVTYNLGIIAPAVLLAPWLGIYAAAHGVVPGAALHLAVQVPPA